MPLPLIYNATSVVGTETLIAPELPFTGAGSFVLADVIADFTTEDVEITCAAEVSDENGQLLQVALTPATIRIDDGVHGGTGSVSGIIEIPGVRDLSGVEVVLTIDGRQVTVITNESGSFEFDGDVGSFTLLGAGNRDVRELFRQLDIFVFSSRFCHLDEDRRDVFHSEGGNLVGAFIQR